MDTKEFIKEKTEELTDKTINKLVDGTAVPKTDDWFGRHNFMSRLIMLVFIGIFIYAFIAPLPLPYAEMTAYLLMGVFALISVGINSIKTVGDVIIKIRDK